VGAGDKYADPARVPADLDVQRHATGYDGQFFYRLSLDPLSREQTEFGIKFDSASARHQRILYPLLIWILSRSHVRSTTSLLIMVNVASYAGLGFLGALFAREFGRSSWWGLIVPLYPGFIVTTALDLAENLASLLLLLGILFLMRKRWTAVALSFAAAAFTRETTLIVPGGLFLAWLLQRRSIPEKPRDRTPPFVFLVPIGLVVAWQLFLWVWWGSHPLFAAGRQFSFPFYSAVRQIWTWFAHHTIEDLFQLMEFAFLATLILAGLRSSTRSRITSPLRTALLLSAGVALTFPAEIWMSQTNFLRAAVEPALVSTLILMETAPAQLPLLGMSTLLFAAANVAVWTGVGRF